MIFKKMSEDKVKLSRGQSLVIKTRLQVPHRILSVLRADHWSGPFELVADTKIYGEDPFIWRDNSHAKTFHVLFHTCCEVKIMSTAWYISPVSLMRLIAFMSGQLMASHGTPLLGLAMVSILTQLSQKPLH